MCPSCLTPALEPQFKTSTSQETGSDPVTEEFYVCLSCGSKFEEDDLIAEEDEEAPEDDEWEDDEEDEELEEEEK